MKRNLGAGLCLWAALASSSPARAQVITLEQVTATPGPAGVAPSAPAWSPDGQTLAFLWAQGAETARTIYTVARDGSGLRRLVEAPGEFSEVKWLSPRELVGLRAGQLVRLTAGGEPPSPLDPRAGFEHLTAAPDGKSFAALLDGDVHLFSAAEGKPSRRLTAIGRPPLAPTGRGTYYRKDVEVGTATWANDLEPLAFSPDGRWLAAHVVDRRNVPVVGFPSYAGDQPQLVPLRRARPGDVNENRQVWVLSVEDGGVWKLPLDRTQSMEVVSMSWSSRSQLLVDRQSDDATLRLLEVADPRARTVAEIYRDVRPSRSYTEARSAWAPDGARVLFLGDLDDRYRIFELVKGHAPRPWTSAASDVDGAWTMTPRGLFYSANAPRPEELQVFWVGAAGRAPVQLTRRAGTARAFPSPRGDVLAVISSDDVTPPALSLVDVAGGKEVTVTRPPPQPAWIRSRYVEIPSREPGARLRLELIGSPGGPAVLGPVYMNTVRNRWGGMLGLIQQLLAQRGYLVVQVDVRGSTGQGRAWREQFLCDFAGKDLDDLEDAVKYLVAKEGVDPARVGIFGSSFGGTLTLYSLLRKPGLFAVGVAGAPAIDASWFGPDDAAVVRNAEACPGAFANRAERFAEALHDSLLIIHGLADDVVPFKTTIDLVTRLNALGKPYQLAVGPSSTHAWMRGPDGPDLIRRLVEHLDGVLRPVRR